MGLLYLFTVESGRNFFGTEYLYYLFMVLCIFFIFSRNLLYFPVPSFLFILPEAIISITEQRDEFYGKRNFLMDRRHVFMLAP